MVKARADSMLRAELKDILFDLVDLNSLSLELQFSGTQLLDYRHWLLNSISYVILARDILGAKEDFKFSYHEIDSDCNLNDLKDLTSRVTSNYSKILMAYDSEIGDELKQVLYVIKLCLLKL